MTDKTKIVGGKYYVINGNYIDCRRKKPRGKELYFNTKNEAIEFLQKKTKREALSSLKKTLVLIDNFETVTNTYRIPEKNDIFSPIQKLGTREFYKETGFMIEVRVNDYSCSGEITKRFSANTGQGLYSQIFIPLLEISQKVLLYLAKHNK